MPQYYNTHKECPCDNTALKPSTPGNGGGYNPPPCEFGDYIIKRYDLSPIIFGDVVFYNYNFVEDDDAKCGEFTPLSFTYNPSHIDINGFIDAWIASMTLISGVFSVTNYGNNIIEFKFMYIPNNLCCNEGRIDDMQVTTTGVTLPYTFYVEKEQLCCLQSLCLDNETSVLIDLHYITGVVTIGFPKLDVTAPEFCGKITPSSFIYDGTSLSNRVASVNSWTSSVTFTNNINISGAFDINATTLAFKFIYSVETPCCGYDFYYTITDTFGMSVHKAEIQCCYQQLSQQYISMPYTLGASAPNAILGLVLDGSQCGIDAGLLQTYTRQFPSLAQDLDYWGSLLMLGYPQIIGYEVVGGVILKLFFLPNVIGCCGNIINGSVVIPPLINATVSSQLFCIP